jgi:catechol 2,3-dioxygenase-like lactoylglutathione lyase family enzyme
VLLADREIRTEINKTAGQGPGRCVLLGVQLHAVVIDCPDPKALARFYAELSGWAVEYSDDEWVTLRGDGDVRLSFQLAPDHQPPRWPGPDHPQQFHLDFWVDDYTTAEPRALELGATLLDASPDHESFRVYADPAGHPFCLCLHQQLTE